MYANHMQIGHYSANCLDPFNSVAGWVVVQLTATPPPGGDKGAHVPCQGG